MRPWIGVILVSLAMGMFFGGLATSLGEIVHSETTRSGSNYSQIIVAKAEIHWGFFAVVVVLGLTGLTLMLLPRRRPTPPPLPPSS
jgi:hypothetical protein